MSKNPASLQKLRGGYYTPLPIAQFLVEWAVQSPTDTILEPSCGDGIFLGPIIHRLSALNVPKKEIPEHIYAVEIDKNEYAKAKEKLTLFPNASPANIYNADFFQIYFTKFLSKRFSVVIGNPPFIRYQYFDDESRDKAIAIMKSFGLKMTKLTNAWVPFLVGSLHLLAKNGRLAMVIPAEILQVKYTEEIRAFLSKFFSAITIITFKKLVFPSIQQEVVLFLGEKNNGEHGINIVELDNIDCLSGYIHQLPSKKELKPIDHSTDKWTKYFLSKNEILLLRSLQNNPGLKKLGDLAEIDVGIVTGRNEFFVIDDATKNLYHLSDYVLPLVGRSANLKGFIFNKSNWKNSERNNGKAYLTVFPDVGFEKLPKNVSEYIRLGENKKFHEGYKCRIRDPWYVVPSVWIPDAFLLRQIHKFPKIILNQTDTVCTDTIHRVRFKNSINKKLSILCFHNSLTFAFSEITGRSYGGGVLELEPSEAENLPIPYMEVSKSLLDELDQKLKAEDEIETILDITDDLLLKKGLGFPDAKIKSLRKIWKKLSKRRINRKFAKPNGAENSRDA